MEATSIKKEGFMFKLVKAYYDFKEIREHIKAEKRSEKQRMEEANAEFSNMLKNIAYQSKYSSLLKEYNALVDVINKKGGEHFLKYGVIPKHTTIDANFTPEEIKTLINLCHPDKHNGKESAVEITKKLLTLRK